MAPFFQPCLVLFPVCSTFWQMSHGSDISRFLESPTQSRLHFHSLMQWLLKASRKEVPCQCLPSEALLNHEARFHNAFSYVSSCLWRQNYVDNTALMFGILAQSLELLNHLARSFDNYCRSRKFHKPFLSSGWKHSWERSFP